MIGRRNDEPDPPPQKEGSASGALEPTQSALPGEYLDAFGFTNWLVLSGRRTPTRQSVYDVTRTTLYNLILYIRHAEESGVLNW